MFFNLNYKSNFFLQKIFYLVVSLFSRKTNNYLHFYLKTNKRNFKDRHIVNTYKTSKGYELPIYNNYRYSIKPGWLFYSCLSAFDYLSKKNLLTQNERDFYDSAKGTRTLEKSLSEIVAVCEIAVKRNKTLFFEDSIDTLFVPIVIPSDYEIRRKMNFEIKQHKVLFDKLRRFGINTNASERKKIIEIGFISGGYSAIAFDKLGFSSSAIDYFYGDFKQKLSLSDYIKNKTKSSTEFSLQDVTKQTEFKEGEFDIVYSASVLEHISDPPAAFKEMHRILKPGGLMIHGYNPYFCPNGGHALGIADCPWGHLRMDQKDYLNFMDEFRPHEAEISKKWIQSDLNKISINELQNYLVTNEFQILFWQQHAASEKELEDLTPQIMAECLSVYPNIGLADLISSTITFAAVKV